MTINELFKKMTEAGYMGDKVIFVTREGEEFYFVGDVVRNGQGEVVIEIG